MGQSKLFKTHPQWLVNRLTKREKLSSTEAAVLLGNDPKNVRELIYRGRLKPDSGPPYLFSISEVRSFVRQKPGPKPKIKAKPAKRFLSKARKEVVPNAEVGNGRDS